MISENEILAIIPARGGSKRIPRKNIKGFLGRPVIEYPVEAALKSGIFSEVMVSTDDPEIAEFAKRAGADVPFMRSSEKSDDHAKINDVLYEVLCEFRRIGREFKYFCCILPTAVFVRPEMLAESLSLMKNGAFDSLIPVVEYSPPIQRAFVVKDSKLSMKAPENFSCRTQDLEKTYYDSGTFYWARTEIFLVRKACLTDNTGTIVLPRHAAQDIDDPEDWEYAEMMYRFRFPDQPVQKNLTSV